MEKGQNLQRWLTDVESRIAGGETVCFSPRGLSMWPTLRPQTDDVYISKAPAYRRGDIVLARTPENPVVLHRLAKNAPGDKAILMGDANLFKTETCATADIIGKVVKIERNGRDISRSLHQRLLATIHTLPPSLRRGGVRILLHLFPYEQSF